MTRQCPRPRASGNSGRPGRKRQLQAPNQAQEDIPDCYFLCVRYASRAGSINPDSDAEDLDHFAWQARYCFDRTLDVAEIADLAADTLNNSRLQLLDIQRVFERIDQAASEIYWPDWPQKLTSIDAGIKLVANLLSSVISGFLSAGILEGKAKMPVAAASELEFVIREYDESGEDPYRLAWILHSFMMRFARRA